MNTDTINQAFTTLINTRAVHHTLGISSNAVKMMRFKLKNDINISMDTKLKLLQKSGWRQEEKTFTRAQLVSLVQSVLKASAAAKEHGAEYLVEKWERKQ